MAKVENPKPIPLNTLGIEIVVSDEDLISEVFDTASFFFLFVSLTSSQIHQGKKLETISGRHFLYVLFLLLLISLFIFVIPSYKTKKWFQCLLLKWNV